MFYCSLFQDGTEIQAFVAECDKQIVGVAVLRREEDIEYIRSHYNVEDFIYFNHHSRSEHGHLHHYALNPIFKHYSKHFLKELLRLGHKTCLYYPLYPAYTDKEVSIVILDYDERGFKNNSIQERCNELQFFFPLSFVQWEATVCTQAREKISLYSWPWHCFLQTLAKHTLVAALQEMVPVRARRQIQYPLQDLKGNAPSERVLQYKEQTYALNHINRKLTLEPKVRQKKLYIWCLIVVRNGIRIKTFVMDNTFVLH